MRPENSEKQLARPVHGSEHALLAILCGSSLSLADRTPCCSRQACFAAPGAKSTDSVQKSAVSRRRVSFFRKPYRPGRCTAQRECRAGGVAGKRSADSCMASNLSRPYCGEIESEARNKLGAPPPASARRSSDEILISPHWNQSRPALGNVGEALQELRHE